MLRIVGILSGNHKTSGCMMLELTWPSAVHILIILHRVDGGLEMPSTAAILAIQCEQVT